MNSANSPHRHFGFGTGIYVVISCMVGAGILTTSGFTLKATGNPWSLLGLWLVGGLMALCGAVTLTELATRFPRVGGDYVFVKEAYGTGAGFVVGWATFIIGFAGPTALIALLSAKYLMSAVIGFGVIKQSPSLAELAPPLLATLMISLITMTLCRGYRESAGFQSLMTILKLLIFVLMILCGLIWGRGNWSHFSQGGWPQQGEWPALATGLIYVGYAYSGWNAAAYLAGEIKSPEKLLARSMIGGTSVVIILYLLMNVLYIYAVSPQAITTMDFLTVEKIAELALVNLFGEKYGFLIGLILGLSLISSVSGYLMTGPRVALVMSRDGMFFNFAGGGSVASEMPVRGTICQACLSIAMIWSGSFLELLNYMSAGLALISGMVVVSIFPLRRQMTELHIYRVPCYPWPPLFYLVLVTWTLSYAIMNESSRWPTLFSIITVMLGIPLGWLVQRRKYTSL